MSFVILDTRDQLKQHIKLWDSEPRRYIIKEEPTICVYSNNNDIQTEYIKDFLKYDEHDTKKPIMWVNMDNITTELIYIKGTDTIKRGVYSDYLIEKEKMTIKAEKDKIITDRLLKEKIIREHIYNEQLLKDKELKRGLTVKEDKQPINSDSDNSTVQEDNSDSDDSTEDDKQPINTAPKPTEPEVKQPKQRVKKEKQDIKTDIKNETHNDINTPNEPNNGVHKANNLINSDYEANKFIDYLLFENAYKDENGQCLVSDVGDIEPTKYYSEKHKKLTPITEPFIDTIMIFKLIDGASTYKQNGVMLVDKEICGLWNTKIRKIAKKYNIELPKHGVVCKKPIKYVKCNLKNGEKDNSINRDAVRKILTDQQFHNYKQLNNKTDLNDAYILPIKIELADEDLDTLHDKLDNFLKELKEYENQIYLLDVDITRDYAGTFNKNELEKHLTENHDFRLEGSTNYEATRTILNNTKSVGTGTLTYIDSTDPNAIKRAKFYNKLLCQWTSPGVAKSTGNHLIDYLYCPDKQLNKTFKNKKGMERGITRQEITLYGGRLPSLKELKAELNEQHQYVEAPIFYYVPASSLWLNITDQITNNLIIYDEVERIILIAYYVNLQTHKATTIRKKLNMDYTEAECERILKYVISHYSYKLLPCNVIRTKKLTSDVKDLDIQLTLKTYQKMNGETQLSRPISLFTSLKELTNKEGKDAVDIEETGFKETTFIKFYIPDKKQNIASVIRHPDVSEYIYNAKDIENGTLFIPKISTNSITKRRQLQNKLDYEKQQRDYKLEHHEQNKKTSDYYNELMTTTNEILAKIKLIEDKEREILNNMCGLAYTISNLPIKSFFTVKAFTFRKTKHDNNALIILRDEDNKLYYGGAYFTFIFNKYKSIWKEYNNNIFGFINFKLILTVQIDKFENDKNNNKTPKFKTINSLDSRINIIDIKTELSEQIEQVNLEIINITLQKLNVFKPSTAIKAEDILIPNKEYNITHLDRAEYRGKKQHFIMLKEHPNIIIKANEFLNNSFNDNPQHFIIKFKTLELKYNSNRNKELQIDIKKKDKKNKFNILLSI